MWERRGVPGPPAFTLTPHSTSGTSTVSLGSVWCREDWVTVTGNVGAILFDFDGTLTATPGTHAVHRTKVTELNDRAPMLRPRLERLRNADITLGIITKSTEGTVTGALESAGLGEFFNGPIVAKACGLDGKVGDILRLCSGSELGFLGQDPKTACARVLLVDDDLSELERCCEQAIQTYPAPEVGGLQDEDFDRMFVALGLQCQSPRGRSSPGFSWTPSPTPS